VAPTRHYLTCGRKPGIFSLLCPFYYVICPWVLVQKFIQSMHIGNPKAVAHVTVDIQCYYAVKPGKKEE